MMNSVQLHGSLSRFMEGPMRMSVNTPAEAVASFSRQIPEFNREFIEGNFFVLIEDHNGLEVVSLETLPMQRYGCTFHIVPPVEGAGNGKGAIKTILGVALFIGSFFIPGSSLILGMSLKTTGILLGAAMALGGVSLLLAPQTRTGETKSDQSSLFSGNTRTEGQDFAIPITYGQDRVTPKVASSQVVSNVLHVSRASSGLVIDNTITGRPTSYDGYGRYR